MKRSFLLWPAAFAASVFFPRAATADDTYAFVAKTSNASTLSFLDPASGRQTSGLPLQLETVAPATYSLDGRFAFVLNFSLSAPETVNVFSLTSGKEVKRISFPNGTPIYLGPGADASKVFALVAQKGVYVLYQINVPGFDTEAVYKSSDIDQFVFSPDGKFVYVANSNTVSVLDASTFQMKGSVVLSGSIGGVLTVSPDSKRLYVSSELSFQVIALDVPAMTLAGIVPADLEAYVAVSPDSSTLYTVANSRSTGQVIVEQVSSATLTVANTVTLGDFNEKAFSCQASEPLAISPDGKTLAVGYGISAPSVTFLNLPAMTAGPISPVGELCGIAFTPASTVAVTNSLADTAEIVDITKGVVSAQVDAGPSPFLTLAAPNGRAFYVSNPWGVWTLSAQTGKVLAKLVLSGYTDAPRQMAFSANRQILFVMDAEGVAELSTSTNALIGYVPGIPAGFNVNAIATSADGTYLFAAGAPLSNLDSYELLVLNQSTGALINTAVAPTLGLFMVVSNDSSTVYYEGIFRGAIYSLSTFLVSTSAFSGTPVSVFGGGMALSPDGGTLYVANSLLDAVEAFDTASQAVVSLPSPEPPVDVAVTPDGSELVVTSTRTSLGLITVASPIIGAVIPVGGATSGISVH